MNNDALSELDSVARLRTVSGYFNVLDNPVITRVVFPSLESVGVNLNVGVSPYLSTVEFPSLTKVGEVLYVSDNDRLSSCAAPELTEVGELLYAQNGAANTSPLALDLSGLTTVDGDAVMYQNGTWDLGRGLARLANIGGSLLVDGLPELASFRAPKLATVGADVEYAGNTSSTGATSFDLSGLVTIGGDLRIFKNPLWELGSGLASLTKVQANLRITENTPFTALALPALTQVVGQFWVGGNPELTSLGLPSLTSVGSLLRIQSNLLLPTCSAVSVRDQLAAHGWSGASTLTGNASDGCTP